MTSLMESAEQDDFVLSQLFISRIESASPGNVTVSPRELVSLLEQGAEGVVLRAVIKHIPKGLVIRAIGSDEANFLKVIRRKRLTKHQTESLNGLTKLWAELRQFFDWDNGMVNDWISQHLPALDGASPLELMSSQEGRCIIRKQLEIMRFGNFA